MALRDLPQPRRVTVVDDSPELLALMGDALRFDGAEIALLGSGATLVDIEASGPDLLVLDLRFGGDGLNGLDIIREARLHHRLRHVPIIVCSGAHDAIAAHGDELGRTSRLAVLPKPFSLEDLEACVEEAIGLRQPQPTRS
jgi:CheY-like chemotaxis protein